MTSIARISGFVLAAIVVTVACGPPIGVRRVAPRTVSADLARSALNSDRPSLFSETVLYRWNLTERFDADPAGALAILRDNALADRSSRSPIFALAELCFTYADDTNDRAYYLAAAVYAYTFLFPGPGRERLEEFDPRARIAADLYNRGLTEAFASHDREHVDLRSGLFPLPFGQQVAVSLDLAGMTWANRVLEDFVPVAELKVSGLGARYRRGGIGAPLAAEMRAIDPEQQTKDYVAPNAKVPVTALLRIADPSAQIGQPVIEASLEVFNAYETRSVEIDGQKVPLEMEPSAALAYSLSRSQVWDLELRGFLLGDILGQEKQVSLYFSEPYRPGRIPVVFVHGTASSPGRWADMQNVLSNSSSLRDRYQYWFFFYETGNPILYSAMKLRETLTEAVARIDPGGADPALRQMVVIGHSQGGLLTKLTAIDSETQLWDAFSRRPIDQLKISTDTRDLLRRTTFVKPLPFVRRVIFISTPHRGSYVAGWSISAWLSRFVRFPQTLVSAAADIVRGQPDALVFDSGHTGSGAVSGMTPGSRFIKALAPIPLAPDVIGHSIIPVTGALPPDGQDDGVVRYESAHIDGVASELVIPHQGHSAQSNPLAIEEVRRILVVHADAVCAKTGVACRREAAGTPPVAEPVPDPEGMPVEGQ